MIACVFLFPSQMMIIMGVIGLIVLAIIVGKCFTDTPLNAAVNNAITVTVWMFCNHFVDVYLSSQFRATNSELSS